MRNALIQMLKIRNFVIKDVRLIKQMLLLKINQKLKLIRISACMKIRKVNLSLLKLRIVMLNVFLNKHLLPKIMMNM